MSESIKKQYFYKKNNFLGYCYILSYIAFFGSIIYFIISVNNLGIIFLLMMILGFFQAGFNQGKHEFLHNTVINNKILNHFFWYFFSIPILVNPHLNKDFHLLHHKSLGTDDDPELSFKVRKNYSFNAVLWDKIKNPFILDLIFLNYKILFCNIYPSYVSEENKKIVKKDSIIIFLTHIFFIGLILYNGSYYLLFIWYFTLEYIGFNILCMFDIAEHRGCDITDFENNSRTVISNYFITYITWFNNYHSVHHKDSKDKLVTFYKRKKYFDLFDKYKTRKIEKSYLKFILKINENPSFYK